MKSRVLVVAVFVSLAAMLSLMSSCSKPQEPVASPPAAAAPAPAPAEAPAPASAPAPPPAVQKPASDPVAAQTTPAAPTQPAAPAADGAPPSALVAGQDYQLIGDGQPFDTAAGQIEVAEIFNYACPACNAFNPYFREWKAKQKADVHVIYIPAEFRPDFLQYARAFWAADSSGLVEKTHDAVYAAIHQQRSLPGEGSQPDEATIAAFYAKYGADATEFQQTMDGFAVSTRIAKAKQFAMHSRIVSTPSLVIDGKYLIKGKTWDDMLRIADQLVAMERKR